MDFISEDYRIVEEPLPAVNTSNTSNTSVIDGAFKEASRASVAAFDAAMLSLQEQQQQQLPNTVKVEEELEQQQAGEQGEQDVKVKRSLSEPPLLARSGSPSEGADAGLLHAITTVNVKQDPQATEVPGENGAGSSTNGQGASSAIDSKSGAVLPAGAASLPGAIPPSSNDVKPENNGGVEAASSNLALVGPQQIQAYAKLEFSFLNFYIQKLSVTIGRRPPPAPAAAAANIVKKLDEEPDVEPLSLDDPSLLAGTVEQPDAAAGTTTIKDEPGMLTQSQIESLLQDSIAPMAGTSNDATSHLREEIAIMTPAELERLAGNKVHVDVDLGPIKAVSRDHARLFFDSEIDPRTGYSYGWSIEVKGRNGLVLDGSWKAKGEVVRLNNGCVYNAFPRTYETRC